MPAVRQPLRGMRRPEAIPFEPLGWRTLELRLWRYRELDGPDPLVLEPSDVAAGLAAELRPSAFGRQWDPDEWRPPG